MNRNKIKIQMSKSIKNFEHTVFSGSAIVITILAIAALLTIGLGLAQLVPKDFRASLALESSVRAEDASWAGVEHALYLLRQARDRDDYFELSAQFNSTDEPPNYALRPYGIYSPPLNQPNSDCMKIRTACPNLDRQLGDLKNGEPLLINDILGKGDSYGLTIWHRRHNVGAVDESGDVNLDDGLLNTTTINEYPQSANINPTLNRDEVRRLDIKGVTHLTLYWKPMHIPPNSQSQLQCQINGSDTVSLVYTLLDDQGKIIPVTRGISVDNGSTNVISIATNEAKTLSLRYLVADPNTSDLRLSNCFARYAINNDTNRPLNPATDTADLGFDVIDSVGQSGGIRRKIRVLVNRESGRPLNIFDFGVVCETCEFHP